MIISQCSRSDFPTLFPVPSPALALRHCATPCEVHGTSLKTRKGTKTTIDTLSNLLSTKRQ